MYREFLSYLSKNIFAKNSSNILKNLKKHDIHDFQSISGFQKEKLLKVLKMAISDVSYYQHLSNKLKLDALTYESFQSIPIMNKDIIRNNPKSLLSKGKFDRNEIFLNTSGGSTGEPVQFYRTKEQGEHAHANYDYALYLNKVNINKRHVDLWGAERDMYKPKTKFDFSSFVQNKTLLNTFVLSDTIILEYIERLNRLKPHFIKAYVHSIYDIAKYINKNKININFKPIIHCTTGPLYPEMRSEIKKAFNNAHVYNFYGSREVAAIACEVTGLSEDLYVLYDNVFIEILDENNQPVKKGEEGEIVITTLNNFYMPLLRYKIGDRAIKGDDLLFGTLRLKKVVGRTLGVIHAKDGTKIDGQFFTTLFFNKNGIKNFQLIQKSLVDLNLKIVKTEEFNENELNEIINRIHKELKEVNIKIDFCDKIDLTSSGKIMYVYSELDI